MCVDYKILAKIITERMKEVMQMVIHVDQQGFIKGGDISGNLILVKEIIEYCNKNDIEGCVIMMDFMKAYDWVDREAMMKVLEKMNFGPHIQKMIRTLYHESTARVVVNGEMTEEFKTTGGVRQGCPLSPLCFLRILRLPILHSQSCPRDTFPFRCPS